MTERRSHPLRGLGDNSPICGSCYRRALGPHGQRIDLSRVKPGNAQHAHSKCHMVQEEERNRRRAEDLILLGQAEENRNYQK